MCNKEVTKCINSLHIQIILFICNHKVGHCRSVQPRGYEEVKIEINQVKSRKLKTTSGSIVTIITVVILTIETN